MVKLSTYLKKYWYGYAIALTCMIIFIALDMVAPFVTKRIIDDVIGNGQTELLLGLLLTILVIGVGRSIFGYLKELIWDLVGSKIAVHIRQDLFRHLQSLSMDFYTRTNTGELMSRVKDDVDKLWNALSYVSMLVVEITIHSTFVIICMFRLNSKLALFPVLCMPFIAVIAVIMEQKLGSVYGEKIGRAHV